MGRMKATLRRLGQRRGGAAAVTYALLIALVGIAALGAIAMTGEEVARLLGYASNVMEDERSDRPPGEPELPGSSALTVTPVELRDIAIAYTANPSYSDALTVTLGNAGNRPLVLQSFTADGAVQIVGDDCPDSLAGSAQCTVTLRAVATANGAVEGAFTVRSSAGEATVPVTALATGFPGGLVMGTAELPLVPHILGGGDAACTPLPIGNASGVTLPGIAVAISGSEAAHFETCTPSATPCGANLAAGENCNLGLRPAGTEIGVYTGTVTVSAADGSTRSRPIIGSVMDTDSTLWIGRDLFLVAPVEAEPVGDCTELRVINVSIGYGLANVTVAGFTGPDAAKFEACVPATLACGTDPMPPYGRCHVGIRLKDISANDTYDATVYVDSADEDPVTRAVQSVGNGFNPFIGLAPALLTVAAEDGQPEGPCVPLPVTNTGIASGLADVAIAGFIGTDVTHFAACTDVANPCGSALDPQESCNLGIRMSALDRNGSWDATVRVTSGDAADAVRPVRGLVTGFGVVLSLGGADAFTVQPTNAQIDGPCTAFPVTNAGTGTGLANLRVDGLSGAQPLKFRACTPSQNPCTAAALPAGDSCNLGLQLTDIGGNGTYQATVRVVGGGSAAVTRPIQGSATGFQPVLEVAEGPLVIAGVNAVLEGACTDIRVSHNGNGGAVSNVSISKITGVARANYVACEAVVNTCTGRTLSGGEDCNLGLRLTNAGDNGTFAASIEIRAPGAAAVERAVTATGTGFTRVMSLGSGDFTVATAQDANWGPCTDFAVTNAGTAIGIVNARIAGFTNDDAQYFEGCYPPAGNVCDADPLRPGESCNLGVRLRGVYWNRDYWTHLRVVADDIAEQQRRLRGTAQGLVPVLGLGSGLVEVAGVVGTPQGACTVLTVRNDGRTAGLVNTAIDSFTGSDAANFDRCDPGSAQCGGELAVGGTCNLGIRLIGADANRSYAATVRVTAAGSMLATRAITASAVGFTPTLSIGTGTLTVRPSEGSETGPCTTVTVTNLAQTGTVTNVAITGFSGSNAPNFSACAPVEVANDCNGRTLSPNDSCSIGVRLTGIRRDGTYTGTMTVGGTGASATSRNLIGFASGFSSIYECGGNYPGDGACYCTPERVTPGGAGWGGCPFFTNDSNPCRGARMLDVVGPEGGWIYVRNYPGMCGYCGTSGNGVSTSGWGCWGGSFTVSTDTNAGGGCSPGYGRVDGVCSPMPCAGGPDDGYQFEPAVHGGVQTVTRIEAMTGGSALRRATATCSLGAFSLTDARIVSITCSTGYQSDGEICYPTTCAAGESGRYSWEQMQEGQVLPVSASQSLAHGQANWSASATCSRGTVTVSAEQASFACDDGYASNGSDCVADATLPPQCSSYTANSDTTRLANYDPGKWGRNEGDLGWVRFTIGTGRLQPTPLGANRCGASATGWYGGAYPSQRGETLTDRTVYFDYTYDGTSRTQYTSRQISITNCGGYYVYNLPGIGYSYGYCVEDTSPAWMCPTGSTWSGFVCNDNGCSAGSRDGYSWTGMSSGGSQQRTRTASIANGTASYSTTASCYRGSVTLASETVTDVTCSDGYVRSGNACVAEQSDCGAGESGGYQHPFIANGATHPVTRPATVSGGSLVYSATARCTSGSVSIENESAGTPSCNPGYYPDGSSCLAGTGRWRRLPSGGSMTCDPGNPNDPCHMMVSCSYDYQTAACGPLGATCWASAANDKLLLQFTCTNENVEYNNCGTTTPTTETGCYNDNSGAYWHLCESIVEYTDRGTYCEANHRNCYWANPSQNLYCP